ncbi:MAG TPA: alpha/beta hydrolase, partial [Polyangiaceae bacterium]
LGYSMGGLVARSACHFAKEAKHAWLEKVKRAMYVGTPHRGAPLERGGRVVSSILAAIPDPTTNLVGQIADLRSAGLQDLGDAELRHEDRARRTKTWRLTDPEHPVPLLPSIEHFLVAGGVSNVPWVQAFFGDSIVPLASAKNESKEAILPADHVKFVPATAHIDLPVSPGVYAHLRAFLEGR